MRNNNYEMLQGGLLGRNIYITVKQIPCLRLKQMEYLASLSNPNLAPK